MSDAVSASTDSVRACGIAPGGKSSVAGAARAVTGSRRNGRPFVSLRNLEIRKVRRTGSRRRVGGIVLIDAPGEAGHGAHEHPHDQRQQHANQGDLQGRSRSVEHSRQQVVALAVGAQGVREPGWGVAGWLQKKGFMVRM